MSLARREFLFASAAIAASAGIGSAKDKAARLPVIDTHQHLWDLDKFSLPWLKQGGPIGRSFVTKDYLRAIEGLDIVKAVYMEVDVAADQKVAEAEYVLELIRNPETLTVAAVIGGSPADDDFDEYVKKFANEPKIIGVRQVLHGGMPAGYGVSPEFIRGVQTLGKFGKTFDLCMRPTDLGDAVKLVDACPDTRFVLDHCGNGSVAAFQKATRDEKAVEQYRRDIHALAKRERVICKISGIVAQLAGKDWPLESLAPVINVCLEAFGPDRVVFASDWPVCTTGASLREWVEGLKRIVADRPAAEQRKLFAENARKFYRL